MVFRDRKKLLGGIGSVASIIGLLIAVYLLGQDTGSNTVVVMSNEPDIEINTIKSPQVVIQKATVTDPISPSHNADGIEVNTGTPSQVAPASVNYQRHEYRPSIDTHSASFSNTTQSSDLKLSGDRAAPEKVAKTINIACKSIVETSIPGVTLRLNLTPNRNSIQKGYVVDRERVELLRPHQEGAVKWYMINKPPNTSGWIEAKYIFTNCPI